MMTRAWPEDPITRMFRMPPVHPSGERRAGLGEMSHKFVRLELGWSFTRRIEQVTVDRVNIAPRPRNVEHCADQPAASLCKFPVSRQIGEDLGNRVCECHGVPGWNCFAGYTLNNELRQTANK